MIGYLSGRLLAKEPPLLWIDVGGVGYEVEAPTSTFFNLPDTGATLTLYTHLTVREDAHILFGFATQAEKSLFRSLIKVTGIGPKSALAVLSGIGVSEFWSAVQARDSARLGKLPGLGKKTVERLLIDLKDHAVTIAGAPFAAGNGTQRPASNVGQAVSALINLGYKPTEAERMATAVGADGKSTEDIIRDALKGAAR